MTIKPSLFEWLFFRLETRPEGIHYRVLQGFQIHRAFAPWAEITIMSSHPNATLIHFSKHYIWINSYLLNYHELMQEIEAHSFLEGDEENEKTIVWDEATIAPQVLAAVHSRIRAGRKAEAAAFLRNHTELDLHHAIEYVDCWSEANIM